MSDIKALSDAATQGVWGQFNVSYGPWKVDAGKMSNAEYVRAMDSSHSISTFNGKNTKKIAQFTHADDAAFAESLVNAYRNGTLVDAKQARRDALQEAVDSLPEQYAIYGNDRTDGYARGFCGGVETYRDALTALMEADT